MWAKTASGAWRRVASRRFKVPTALTSKSSKGRDAARSWLGCAAVWTIILGLRVSMHERTFGPVPNVQLVVAKVGMQSLKTSLIPPGVAAGAEEVGAQVVVHAMDLPA